MRWVERLAPFAQRLPPPLRERATRPRPFEMRTVEGSPDPFNPAAAPPRRASGTTQMSSMKMPRAAVQTE